MKYRRALNEVRDFVTENLLLDLKSRSMKNKILLFICLFEIATPISAFISNFVHINYRCFVYYYTITFTYLTFCLLNILTTYLTRVYTCKPDSRKDRRALIIFFIKLNTHHPPVSTVLHNNTTISVSYLPVHYRIPVLHQEWKNARQSDWLEATRLVSGVW